MMQPRINIETRISLYYLLFGMLWILLSDRLLVLSFSDPLQLTTIQTYKGWLFVTASALLVYFLLRHYLAIQRQMNADLQENEERYRLLINHSMDVILLTAPDGAILAANPAASQVFGWTEPEICAIGRKGLIDHNDQRWKTALEERARTGRYSGELNFVRKNGKSFPGEISTVLFHDGKGREQSSIIIRDITERNQMNQAIINALDESQRRLQRIETLHQIDIAISSNYNLAMTLDMLLDQVQRHLAVDAVAIFLFEQGKLFQYTTNLGIESSKVISTPIKADNHLAEKVAQKGELVKISEIDDPRFITQLHEEGFQDYYGIPLKAKGRLIGVLELYHCIRLSPDAEWLSYYETLAGQAAVAIENAQLFESLRRANEELTSAYDATIEGWSMAMDLRDRETEGHTQRVTELTVALARKMNIYEAEIVHFRRGALLHDIGKMGIPDSILLKPDLLTEEERKIIQRHPKYAFDMLQSIDYLRLALDIPHYHHEKWDGTGYPYGLKTEQIPLCARLFAIIDVYDALTSDRPYRKAWSEQGAIQYIVEQSGKHFDPNLVPIFIQYMERNTV